MSLYYKTHSDILRRLRRLFATWAAPAPLWARATKSELESLAPPESAARRTRA